MSKKPVPPSENQIKYAKNLAKQHGDNLPEGLLTDVNVCKSYLDGYTNAEKTLNNHNKEASDSQQRYANSIYSKLADRIEPSEIDFALLSSSNCSKFIKKYHYIFDVALDEEKAQRDKKKQVRINRYVSRLKFLTPQFRKDFNATITLDEKLKLSKEASESHHNKGFTKLDPHSLKTNAEKLMGYWLEGLQSTAFNRMGELPNLLGKSNSSFDLCDIEKMLNETPCKGVEFNPKKKTPEIPPVRYLLLKLVNRKKTFVISVLPLLAMADEERELGYRWKLEDEQLPLFNRNLLGEYAELRGLMLENVDAFEDWAEKQLEPQKDDKETKTLDEDNNCLLSRALELWDNAFDILAKPGYGGLKGWISRFNDLKTKTKNDSEFWQIKKLVPVFTLVDGGVVNYTSLSICNAYRQIIEDPYLLGTPSLDLFNRVVDLSTTAKEKYNVSKQNEDFVNISQYFGHMDTFKSGKCETYPLDSSQRDALIALKMTRNGELLAVNGPPGTGKTSLLRGVIASEWITPLFSKQSYPSCPFILACAATNQAVTNIISSFSETPGTQLFDDEGAFKTGTLVKNNSRWVPVLSSYGWYVPSQVNNKIIQKYGIHQLLERKAVRKAWKFKCAAADFSEFSEKELEVAYIECAESFFGTKLELLSILERIRNQVNKDKCNIGFLQESLKDWICELTKFTHYHDWTEEDENSRLQLIIYITTLKHDVSDDSRLNKKVDIIDQKIKEISVFNSQSSPSEKYTKLCQEDLSLAKSSESNRFFSYNNRYDNLTDVEIEIEKLRKQSFLFKIKTAFSSVVRRHKDDSWFRIRHLLYDFNIYIEDDETDIDVYLDAIEGEKNKLSNLINEVAYTGLNDYLFSQGLEIMESDPDGSLVWLNKISCHYKSLNEKRAGYFLEQKMLEKKLSEAIEKSDELENKFQEYITLNEKLKASKSAIETCFNNFHCDTSANPLIKPIKTILSRLKQVSSEEDIRENIRLHKIIINKKTQDWLDINVRSRMFHLTARYWEGRYIKSCKENALFLTKDETYSVSSEHQLRELAMLAPVFVTTANSVPKMMRRKLDDLTVYAPPYLFGVADLLVIDEAGQGTSDIGAGAFLFARKAIVVGDVDQLEPIWCMDAAVDQNLARRFFLTRQAGIVDTLTPYESLKSTGVLMASGSVMKMAQKSTQLSNPDFPDTPGLTLTNHYRCHPDIIGICNDMVYRGVLQVATPLPDKHWRPELSRLGFLVIDHDVDTKKLGGSKQNIPEANGIAKWIHENETSIMEHYGKGDTVKLKDLVAIVTPFKGQKKQLKLALAREYGLSLELKDKSAIYNQMTIDTVHSLQGAERQIIIFSMVETKDPDNPQFYDKGYNLINVAVSRAKSMLVVAITQKAVDYARRLDSKKRNKPSDYLWQALVKKGSRLNSSRIVIVESPNKIKTVSKALGSSIEIEVIATEGHFSQLEEPRYWNALIADKPKWNELKSGGVKLLERLQILWPDINIIYLALDPDPEGEAIAWHILRIINQQKGFEYVNSKAICHVSIKRMRFYNLTPQAISSAYENASVGLDAGMLKSALTRMLIDYLISSNYPALIGLGDGKVYMAGIGRVQLGILDIIAKQTKKKPQFVVSISIPLIKDEESLCAFVLDPNHSNENEIWKCQSIEDAKEAVIRIKQRLGDSVENIKLNWFAKPLQQISPYPSLNTARLLALAWRANQLMPKDTMASLQRLFEGEHSSNKKYEGDSKPIRTENIKLPTNHTSAHPMLEPLNYDLTPEDAKTMMDQDDANIYGLLWNAGVSTAIDGPAIRFECLNLKIVSANTRNDELKLIALQNNTLEKGWKQILPSEEGLMDVDFFPDIELIKEFPENIQNIVEEASLMLEANGSAVLAKEQCTALVQCLDNPKTWLVKAFPLRNHLLSVDHVIERMAESEVGKPSTYGSSFEKAMNNDLITFNSSKNIKVGQYGEQVLLALGTLTDESAIINASFSTDLEKDLNRIESNPSLASDILNKYCKRALGETTKLASWINDLQVEGESLRESSIRVNSVLPKADSWAQINMPVGLSPKSFISDLSELTQYRENLDKLLSKHSPQRWKAFSSRERAIFRLVVVSILNEKQALGYKNVIQHGVRDIVFRWWIDLSPDETLLTQAEISRATTMLLKAHSFDDKSMIKTLGSDLLRAILE